MRRILIGPVLFLVLIVAIGVWRQKTNEPVRTYQMQTNEEGGVSVGVTPINLSSRENMSFKVVLNTHLVELDYDLKELSVLIADENEYKALSWSGGKGGHHLEGNLVFPKISKKAKAVKLTMKGIDNVERIFEWDL